MKIISALLISLLVTTTIVAQKEDFTWIVNFSLDCNQSPFPESCGASIISFKENIVEFYKEPPGLLLSCTNAVLCNRKGDLLLYSNGMSIHGKDHLAIVNGDTISYGNQWERNYFEDEGETAGFRIETGAVFIPNPLEDNRYYLLYTNYDGIDSTDLLNKRYADILVNDDGSATVLEKDIVFADAVNSVGQMTCAQHANGRDWWLIQNRDDTLLTYLIDPDGIQLYHKTQYANSWGSFSP